MAEPILIPPPIQKRNLNQTRLSSTQAGLWFLQQFSPESHAYNVIYLFKLSGGVNRNILENSLNSIIRRHEILRTIYPTDLDGLPCQVIQPFVSQELLTLDYSSLSAEDKEHALHAFAMEQGSRPFDLQHGPISRFALLHCRPDEDYLFFAIHHIAFDDWSRYIFIQDLLQFYESFQTGLGPRLPTLPIQYSDYAIWQNEWISGKTRTAFIEHWKSIFSGELPILAFPSDHPRQVLQTYHGSSYKFELSQSFSTRIKEFCRKERLTPSHFFMAAYALFLMRYTGQEDIIIGCPFANRPRSEQGNLIGYFINTLPIRLNLGNNPSVRELLKQTRSVMLDASTWKALPFDTLVAELAPHRELNRPPIYQAMINILNVPKRQRSIPGLEIDLYLRDQLLADFDLSMELSDLGDDFNAALYYNTDLFDESTIYGMASHFQNILEEMVSKPDGSLSEMDLMSKVERHQILVEWNNTTTEFPNQSCLHQLFESQVVRSPDSVAVVFDQEQLTYRELNALANRLANHLRKLGVGPEGIVGLYFDRSIDAIVGILGILKAGGVYLPLATDLPAKRLAFCLADARPIIILTMEKLRENLSGANYQLVCLDSEARQIAGENDENLKCNTSPENLACIIYTSGSTGEPKGVMLAHRGFCNNLHYYRTTYQPQVSDRVLQHMPLSFDFSFWEIFVALVSGACIVVADQNKKSDIQYLVQLIDAQRITIADFVPSHLEVFLESQSRHRTLRTVISGGEELTPEIQKLFFSKLSACLINTYGPTETSIDVSHWICNKDDGNDKVPIGKPIGNVQLYILDQRLLPVPIGVIGELFIGGECLARGYLNQPELTAEKFIADPFSKGLTGKLFRTGDLARYLPDGNIEFVGRKDSQVKLRGFRIELGEIEHAIRQYNGIQQAVVITSDARPIEKRLLAYFTLVSGMVVEVDKLLLFLQEKLPAYMLPSSFIKMESFPLTLNGKIDRKALPIPESPVTVKYIPAQNEVERQIGQVWEAVLGISPIGMEDDFFDMGGNSLLAARLCMEIEKKLGVSLPIVDLFRFPTIRQLVERPHSPPEVTHKLPIGNMDPSQPFPIPVHSHHLGEAPLSFSQESLWFLQQLNPKSTAYNTVYVLRFSGGIDVAAMEHTLNELVRRHEPLRTVYPGKDGKPVQVIQPYQPFLLPAVDFSGQSREGRQQAVHNFITENGSQPFNLQEGPVVRFAILHCLPEEDFLFFCTHHIGTDAWSSQIIYSELERLYASFRAGKQPTLPEMPVQYADYATWQREWMSGKTLAEYLEHWRNILSGDLPVLEFPTDRPRPVQQSFRGAIHHFQLPSILISQMTDFCKQEHKTLFQLLLEAYAILLMRYSGQEDIIIGCPFANRSSPELDGLVGLFVNTLPIRIDLKGNPSMRELLERIQTIMVDATTWQAVPFDTLVSEISPQRDLSRNPVFQVTINFINLPNRETFEGMEIGDRLLKDVPSQFDLSMDFTYSSDATLESSIKYNIDLFENNTIINMAAHFQNLLGEMVNKAGSAIADLEMLSSSEWRQSLIEWNKTSMAFPQNCIQDLFSDQARNNPANPAIVCNGNTLTYGDLEIKANQLAHYLRKKGVEAESRVGIFLPRSERTIIALLAVLKAGAAYIPLDITTPKERFAYMIEDSKPAVIITESMQASHLPGEIHRICLDTEAEDIAGCELENLISSTTNDSLAYLMYTSGSTGRPKGVMNTHKGIVNYMTHMTRTFHFGPSDRVIQFTPISFDSSVWNILGTLSYGGTLFFLDDDQMRNPDYIYSAIIDHQATYINLVPTMLRAICESALVNQPKENSLRLISSGGEVLREADIELAHRTFGESVKVNNQYGPTECSISAIHFLIPDVLPKSSMGVPIGRPIGNARAYILDAYLHPVPLGTKGELFIGGVGVGLGYWNRPDLTTERFLMDPFRSEGRMYGTGDMVRQLADGNICFIGRSDDQVKIRSYRVELGEIEAVLNEFPGVKDAVVVISHQVGSDRLAAFITPTEADNGQLVEKLHAFLAERLPFYMLPSLITLLDSLPLTLSGKVDRLALPLPETNASSELPFAPRNETETRLVSIWKEVLGIEQVGVLDNFFELGGHSLLAVGLFARIKEEFGCSLPLQLLFKEGTVEGLAEALIRFEKSSFLQGITPIRPEGSKTPLFMISPQLVMRDLAFTLAPGRPVFGLASVENGKEVYRKTIQDTAEIYYHNLVDFYPQGPYLLVGHSGRGLFTLELARYLLQNGKDVAFLGLLDTYPHRNVPYFERLQFHASSLLDKDFKGILLYVRATLQRFITRTRIKTLDPLKTELYQNEGRVQVQDVMDLLMRTYVPKPYPGKVTLFSINENSMKITEKPMKRWRKTFIGQLNIVIVPGDHISMLKQPYVTELAEKLDSLLPLD